MSDNVYVVVDDKNQENASLRFAEVISKAELNKLKRVVSEYNIATRQGYEIHAYEEGDVNQDDFGDFNASLNAMRQAIG